MSVNILGGLAKGFALATPRTSLTRPTSVLLKRRLFDYFQNLSNHHFVDLCAGSGSIGLEAISRGAESLIAIENNYNVYKILQSNVKSYQKKYGQNNIQTQKEDIKKWLVSFFQLYATFDLQKQQSFILFFDPPYEKIGLYEDFFTLLKQENFKGLAIIEACRQKTMSQEEFIHKFGEPDRNYQQGTSFLYLYDYN